MKRTLLYLLPLTVLGMAACAGSTSTAARSEPTPQMRPSVHVVNNGVLDANVYVVVSSTAWRLGSVTSLGEATLRFPPALVTGSDIRVLVDPIGSSSAYLSDPMIFDAHEHYELDVENTLALSTFHPAPAHRG